MRVIVPAFHDSDCAHTAAVSTQDARSAILALANVSQVVPSHKTAPVPHLADVRVTRCGVEFLYNFCTTFEAGFVSIERR